MNLRDFLFHEEPGITLYCGDCREVLPLLTGTYEALLADPPYGVGKKYGEGQTDSPEAFGETMRWLSELGLPTAITIPSTRLYDVPRPQWIGVWHKPASFGYWATPFYSHWEAVCFYNLGPEKRMQQDVWSVNPEKPNGHPTPKPLLLMANLLRALDRAYVLDPFCGSGTTLRAAKDIGIAAIGIEIEPRYCEIAVKRLRQEVLAL